MTSTADHIRDQILARYCSPPVPGVRLPAERELMRQFAVSRPTIRTAMAELVQDGYLRRFPGRGTFVLDPEQKSVPVNVRDLTICLLARTLRTAEGTHWLSAAMDQLYLQGAAAMANVTHNDAFRELELLQQAVDRGVDGVVVHPSHMTLDSPTLRRRLQELNVGRTLPLVVLCDPSHYPGATVVWIDEKKAGYAATRHLIDRGHRRIAHIGFPRLRNTALRATGFHEAMGEAGLPVEPDDVIDISAVPHSDLTVQMGRNAARILLSSPRPPSAVFVYWTEVAAGVMFEALDRGLRIPDDLAIVGMDAGVEEPTRSRLPVPITNVWIDMEAIGLAAVNALFAQIGGEPAGSEILLEAVLRQGGTTPSPQSPPDAPVRPVPPVPPEPPEPPEPR